MKWLLTLVLTCCQLVAAEPQSHRSILAKPSQSTICLNMIVKNESQVIERCLDSVKPLIDYWVVVDTGSSDQTREIIKECLKNIPGELHERPWVDFAHNRNEALALAKGKADYLFFLDADDTVQLSPHFRKKKLDKDVYQIDIHCGKMVYGNTALVKTSLPWKWTGVVHETITCPQVLSGKKCTDFIIKRLGGGSRSSDPEKYVKDAALLEKALQDNPSDSRSQFYLAQSYRDAGKWEAALKNYEKRVGMGGEEEEIFWSLYQIGQLKEELKHEEKEIVKAYIRAYQFRPRRLEPLCRLCYYYRCQENYLMGYLVGNFALNAFALHPRTSNSLEPKHLMLYRPNDLIYLETWVYDYALLLEYSICAYWIGKYQEAKEISDYLLARSDLSPTIRTCIENNRRYSVAKLVESNP